MSPTLNPNPDPAPEPEKPVQTACGGWVLYSPETPWVLYRGEAVFFCTPGCKTDYESSPETSRLAGRNLLDWQ